MLKTLGTVILVLMALIIFVTPLRDYMNNLFYKEKSEIREEEIIGAVSGYNPRVEEIQRILKNSNLELGTIDGLMGKRTREVIKVFQKTKGLKPTGKIDQETYLALNREKENPPQPQKTIIEKTAPRSLKVDDRNTRQDTSEGKKELQDEIMSYRLQSKNRTAQIQASLKKAGFYKGEIDGKTGPQTERAIKAFQKSKGLVVDGVVGVKTWEELNKYSKE